MARLNGAGEGYAGDTGRGQERLADDRAASHDEVQDAGRDAGAVQDVDEGPGRARHEIGRFEDDTVPVGKRRRDLPGGYRCREVPRRDDADHADRLARDLDRDTGTQRRNRLTRQPHGLAGEEAQDLARPDHLADAIGQRLALLTCQQAAELVAASEDFRAGTIEDVRSRRGGRAGPGRKGGQRRVDGSIRLGLVGLGEEPDDLGEIRGVLILAYARPVNVLAGDEVLMQLHRTGW